MKKAKKELVDLILDDAIKDPKDLEKYKSKIAKKHNLSKLFQNAELLKELKKYTNNEKYLSLLRLKPVRTGSGVAVIAVMCEGYCPGSCIFCPSVKNIPKSYTGVEPASLRARRAFFDPKKQIENRLKQLKSIGHPTDKCELIVMGGTFLAMDKEYKEKFMLDCFNALNGFDSKTLKKAQKENEKSEHRCVGLTFETRADFCQKKHVKEMLSYGATRVELGVQTVYDDVLKFVERGHLSDMNIKAIKTLKQAGLKVTFHMMIGLPGSNKEKDVDMFKEIFNNPDYQPDEIKIYPTLVIPNTVLYKMWKKGEYKPLTTKQTIELLIKIKQLVPSHVRIKRIMRDISEKKVVAGPKTTNLRQLTTNEMDKRNIECNCIRCREIFHKQRKKIYPDKIRLKKKVYNASNGKEIFLSYEDSKNNILLGFLRLRLGEKCFVRELHVYGPMLEIGKHDLKSIQHRSYGKRLLKKAEKIAKENNYKQIKVISGIGVREYYRKLGYRLEKNYMVKNLE